ncbi:MAG: efflux transporter outer membrane subunit [Sedimentisphaerales bacterium]
MSSTQSIILVLTGCAVGPNYSPPEMEMPKQWLHSSANHFTIVPEANDVGWWEIFNDEDLDSLIQQAIVNNKDVMTAFYKIEAARALRDATIGQYYPSINTTGSYSRSLYSSISQVPVSSKPFNLYTWGFSFLWEVDLFGKIKRSAESSQASDQASIEDYRDIMVTLLSDVCNNYIELRTTQERIQYAESSVETQRKTLELTKSLYQAELVSELDVRQAEFNLANTESQIPLLRVTEEASFNSLAVLVGRMPGTLRNELSASKSLSAVRENIDISLPANLIRQRPDIRRAERQLAAQTANIGVTEADLYPSLTLSGNIQTQSLNFSGLGNLNNTSYSYGPGITWNIFNAGITRNNVKIQKAIVAELLSDWQNTVLTAVEDVQNAMYSYIQDESRRKSLEESVVASRRSVDLVQNLYASGLTDFQNVLDTEHALFLQQDRLAVSKGLLLQDIVLIYKAFGAGWQNIEIQK